MELNCIYLGQRMVASSHHPYQSILYHHSHQSKYSVAIMWFSQTGDKTQKIYRWVKVISQEWPRFLPPLDLMFTMVSENSFLFGYI